MHARSATRPVAASCCVAPSPSRAPGRAAGRRPHQRQAAAAAAHQAAAAPHRRHLPPPAAVAAAGQPSSNSAAAIPQASAQLPLADDQQLWEEVERCVAAAEALEGQGQAEEAIEMVQAALDDLQSRYGAAFGLTLLHQTLWDMLYAAGRHSEALRQAAAAHSAVQTRFGAGSAEVQMLAVRLGMSIAGVRCWLSGDVWGLGCKRVLDAVVPVLLVSARRYIATHLCMLQRRRACRTTPTTVQTIPPPCLQPAAGWRKAWGSSMMPPRCCTTTSNSCSPRQQKSRCQMRKRCVPAGLPAGRPACLPAIAAPSFAACTACGMAGSGAGCCTEACSPALAGHL